MKNRFLFITFIIFLFLTGCEHSSTYKKYDLEFFNTFDTVIQVTVFEKNEETANKILNEIRKEFEYYNKIYDKYNNYEGINNLKTINDNAGIQPVKVDQELIELIEFGVYSYKNISNKNDITIGNAVDLWNDYRELYTEYKDEYTEEESKEKVEQIMQTVLPDEKAILNIKNRMNINDIIIDKKNSTVYLKEKGECLDLGGIAKGYATEKVADNAEKNGLKSGIISAGGNVKIIGKPIDGREYFKIAIEDPFKDNEKLKSSDGFAAILNLNNTSVVTSGDYQRYFDLDGKRYCHIIDPEDLTPKRYYNSVTVITKDSGLCDFMSTALFLMPYEKGLKLCEKMKVDAIWIFEKDGKKEMLYTEGAKRLMENEE